MFHPAYGHPARAPTLNQNEGNERRSIGVTGGHRPQLSAPPHRMTPRVSQYSHRMHLLQQPLPVFHSTPPVHVISTPQQPQTVIYHGRRWTNTPPLCLSNKVLFAAFLIIPTILFFTVPIPLNFGVTVVTSTILLLALALSTIRCYNHAKGIVTY